MENALIIGATGGIGQAVTAALTERGAAVTTLSRRENGLDISDPASVRSAFEGLEGPFDLVFIATGILAPSGGGPEKSVAAIEAPAMAEVMAVNAIGPALLIQAALPRSCRATGGRSLPSCRRASDPSGTTVSGAGIPTAPRRPR